MNFYFENDLGINETLIYWLTARWKLSLKKVRFILIAIWYTRKTSFIFASLFGNEEGIWVKQSLERWVSGWNHMFAKHAYVLKRTGGSNPPLSAESTFKEKRFKIKSRGVA